MSFLEYILNYAKKREDFFNFRDIRNIVGKRFYYVSKCWYRGKYEYNVEYDVFDRVTVYKDNSSIMGKNSDASDWYNGQFFLNKKDAEDYFRQLKKEMLPCG